MRILGIERDQSACNFYRNLSPLSQLAKKGLAEVDFVYDGAELGTEFALDRVLTADLILFHRPANSDWFNFIRECQKAGKTIVTDYDDDPFNTSPWNPYYKHIGVEDFKYQWPDGNSEWLWKDGVHDFNIERNIIRRDMFWACFKKSDMITTTTPILKETLEKINKNTIVLPNSIDFEFFPECDIIKTKEIRIGWQGGSSHYEDLYMINDDIVKILKKHKNVKFIYLGDLRFKGLLKDAPQDQIEWHCWGSHEVYPYRLKFLNLDIGLCPVVDNVFNRNKSAIKWMEYSVVGASTISSDCLPYSTVIEDGKTGVLSNEKGWFDAMDMLIRDKEKRASIFKKAYEEIRENHNIEKNCMLWYDSYEKLLKQEVKL